MTWHLRMKPTSVENERVSPIVGSHTSTPRISTVSFPSLTLVIFTSGSPTTTKKKGARRLTRVTPVSQSQGFDKRRECRS